MDPEKDGNAPESGEDKDKSKAPAPDNTHDKGEHMIPKSRFDQVVNQRKEAETALAEFVETLVEQVPEDKRELIPDLPPAQKGKWLQKALKEGLFSGSKAESGPDSKRPGGKPPTNLDGMSPYEMRAAGYKK